MKPAPITAARLESLGACSGQVALFRKHFGEKPAPLTKRTVLRFASVFNWEWAARHLLTPAQRAAYNKAEAPAWEACNKAIAPAWEAYNKASASARGAHNKALASAQEAYRTAIALAFLSAYTGRA